MSSSASLRPRELALLLLASGDLLPRQRARDQRPDLIGIELKRRVLTRLADLDPEPADLESALLVIVEEFGPPTGPTRSTALSIRDDWQAACASPAWVNHLRQSAGPDGRGQDGGQLPS